MLNDQFLGLDSNTDTESPTNLPALLNSATGARLPVGSSNDYAAIAGLNRDALRDSLQTVVESYRSLEALERDDPNFSHIPPEMRKNLEERKQLLERRKQEIIKQLASPPDWKQYVLPTLIAAYVLKDDPEALGMVLATSALGYENWRRSDRDRYMQSLLKVQNEEDRLHRTMRQWQEFSTNRNLRLLTQARILANTMSTQVQRGLTNQLREQHRAWMRRIAEERLNETRQARMDRVRREATTRYWATVREMERWVNNYPSNRAEIYEMFRPILDDYASAAGLSGIHNNAALRSATSVGQMTSYLRLLRLAELARGVQSDDDNALGAAIGALGSQSQMLGLVRNAPSVARTVRDAQLLTSFIDETTAQISLLYPEMGTGAITQLQTVADGLGLQVSVTADNFEQVRQQILDALNASRQRIQTGALRRTNDFSLEFAQATLGATGGRAGQIDPQKNIAEQIKAWVLQQLSSQLSGLTGNIAAPPTDPAAASGSGAAGGAGALATQADPVNGNGSAPLLPSQDIQNFTNAFDGQFYALSGQRGIEQVYSSATDFVAANPAGLFGNADESTVQQVAQHIRSQSPNRAAAANRILLVYRYRNNIPAPLMHSGETPMRQVGHTAYDVWTESGRQPVLALVVPVQNAFANNAKYREQIHRWTWLQVKKRGTPTIYSPNPNTSYDFVVLKTQDETGNPVYQPMLVVSAVLRDASTTARVPIAFVPVTHFVGMENNRVSVNSGVNDITATSPGTDSVRWLAEMSAWAQAVSSAAQTRDEARLKQLGDDFVKKYRAGFQQNRAVMIFTNATSGGNP